MRLVRMKVQPPRCRPGILRRQRLLDFLIEHRSQKLILISAPAGYGKTTLVVDYASAVPHRVCWYLLEETDREPTVFIGYIIETIHRQFPQFGDQARHALEAAVHEIDNHLSEQLANVRLSEVIEILLNELYETVTQDFVLVLNDYHEVESPRINALMIKLLRYLPGNAQCMILSRDVPMLDLPQLAARQEVAGLGVEELRFTTEEARLFLQQSSHHDLSQQQTQTLVQRFDGWITGIVLGTKVVTRSLIPQLADAGDGTSQLFAYLATEVLARQDEDVQRFLVETSVLRCVSASLCDALLERQDSRRLLSVVEAKGLFLERLDNDGETLPHAHQQKAEYALDWIGQTDEAPWYRYHKLFRDFLYSRLRRQAPERHRALCQRAAELLIEANELDEAIPYLLIVGEQRRAALLLDQIRRDQIFKGQVASCARWLAELTPGLIEERPGLLLLRAQIYCRTGKLDEAITLVQRVESMYRERADTVGIVESLIVQCRIFSLFGRFREMIARGHESLKLLERVAKAPDTSAAETQQVLLPLAALAHHWLGNALYHCGKSVAAHEQNVAALDVFRSLGDWAGVAQQHKNLAVLARVRSEDSVAESHLREVIRIWSAHKGQQTHWAAAMAFNDLAVLYLMRGLYEQAMASLREGLALVEQTGNLHARGYIVGTMADVQREMGQGTQAEATYAEAWSVAEQVHEAHLSFWIALGRAENHAHRGELDLAREHLALASHFLPRHERGNMWGVYYQLRSLIASQVGDSQEAITNLRRAAQLLRASSWRYAWCRVMARLATLLQRQGATHAAYETVTDLLGEINPAEASPSLLYTFVTGGEELLRIVNALPEQHCSEQELRQRAHWLARYLETRVESAVKGDTFPTEHAPAESAEFPQPTDATPQSSEWTRRSLDISDAPGNSGAAEGAPPTEASVATIAQAPKPDGAPTQRTLFQIFAMGEPRVYREDQLVTEWRSAKALELLLYFIECRAPQRKDIVLEALWPEAPLQRADVLFRSTLYRLRQAIGQDCIVYRNGLYWLELVYTYDVREYEEALAGAQRLDTQALEAGEPLPDEALAVYQRAVALYGGSYCEPIYADWCGYRRETLQRGYMAALLRLAQAEWEAGRLDESAELWRCLLRVDNCAEEAHRGLILYYAARGHRVMAVRQYQRCLAALEALHVPPAPETVALYRHTISQNGVEAPQATAR